MLDINHALYIGLVTDAKTIVVVLEYSVCLLFLNNGAFHVSSILILFWKLIELEHVFDLHTVNCTLNANIEVNSRVDLHKVLHTSGSQ